MKQEIPGIEQRVDAFVDASTSEPHKISEPRNEYDYYRALQKCEAELAEALRRADTAEELLFDSRKREAVLEARLNLTRRHWLA